MRFNYIDAPLLRRTRARVYAEMERCLDELATHPSGEVSDLTDRLVWCPQPMRALLRDRYRSADATTKARVLEVRARRYYRIRELRQLRCQTFGPHLTCLASYAEDGQDVRLVHGYVSLDDLPDFARQLRPFLGALPQDQRVVVDVESWRTGEWQDADPMAAELADLLAHTDFGPVLHRLDITITNASGPEEAGQAEEHLRTQHFTYRHDKAGFSEDLAALGTFPPTDRQRGRQARSSRRPRARSPVPSTQPATTARWWSWPTSAGSTAHRRACANGSWSMARRSAAR